MSTAPVIASSMPALGPTRASRQPAAIPPARTLDPSFLLSALGSSMAPVPPPARALAALRPLCDLFLQEMRGRISQLRAACAQRETLLPGETAEFLLHAFRGSASNFGALRLVQIALEVRPDDGWEEVDRVTGELDEELARVGIALGDLLTPS